MKVKISMRTLLLAFVPLAVVVAWFSAWQIQYVRKQKVIENFIGLQGKTSGRDLTGRVGYDYQFKDDGSGAFSQDEAPGPAWLRHYLGENFFATVVSFKAGHSDHQEELENLNVFSCFKELKHLHLFRCSNLRTLDGLQKLQELEELTLAIGPELKNFDALYKLPRLKLLRFESLNSRHDFNLTKFESLEQLDSLIFTFSPQTNLDGLSNLKSLRVLQFRQCPFLKDLGGISDSKSLEELNLLGCMSVESLREIPELKKLTVVNCEKISQQEIHAYKARFPNTLVVDDFKNDSPN